MISKKKTFAILFIGMFLASMSLCLLKEDPKITVVVNTIQIETDYGKPSGSPGKPDKPDVGKPGDYKLMGVKWSTLPLTLYVEDEGMVDEIGLGASEWDRYTNAELVSTVEQKEGITIFDEVEAKTPDYQNELVWADLDSGIIAVCYTWSYGDDIIQFDIAFNTDFVWGDAEVTSGVMDLQNIATHELGHGFGLADIYKRNLSYLTMYGYSGIGDVSKRDLAQGDIDGIKALYG